MELIYERIKNRAKIPNRYYKLNDETIVIEVIDSKNNKYYSYIDFEDFDKVNICNWKIRKDSNTYYLCNSKYGFIHRIIKDCPKELTVDHIDGNGLNNKKYNLRNVTNGVNSFNKRNSKMIYFDEKQGRYRVYWRENGKQKSKSFYLNKYEDAFYEALRFKDYICEYVYKRPTVSSENSAIVTDVLN